MVSYYCSKKTWHPDRLHVVEGLEQKTTIKDTCAWRRQYRKVNLDLRKYPKRHFGEWVIWTLTAKSWVPPPSKGIIQSRLFTSSLGKSKRLLISKHDDADQLPKLDKHSPPAFVESRNTKMSSFALNSSINSWLETERTQNTHTGGAHEALRTEIEDELFYWIQAWGHIFCTKLTDKQSPTSSCFNTRPGIVLQRKKQMRGNFHTKISPFTDRGTTIQSGEAVPTQFQVDFNDIQHHHKLAEEKNTASLQQSRTDKEQGVGWGNAWYINAWKKGQSTALY